MTKLKDQSNKLLELVRKGRRPGIDRLIVYGVEGVGKTTFGAGAPAPIFLTPEDGANYVDVESFPAPKDLNQCMAYLDAIIEGDHEYKTLVIDTLDWCEKLIVAHVCKENEWNDIEDPGWGKGYNQVALEWGNVVARLDRIRDRGVQVVMLAHSETKLFNAPDDKGYSRYNMMMSRKGAAVCKQWADQVLFARYEVFTKEGKDKRIQGISSGRRVLHTEWNAAFDAKNRCGLPPEIDLDWDTYAAARDSGGAAAAESLKKQCTVLIEALDADKQEKATKHIAKQGDDPVKLNKALDWLRSHVEEEVEDGTDS